MYGQAQGEGRPSSKSTQRPKSLHYAEVSDAKVNAYKKYEDLRYQSPGIGDAWANSMRGGDWRLFTNDELQWAGTGFGVMFDMRDLAIINGPGTNPDASIALNIAGNPAITEGDNIFFRKDVYLTNFADRLDSRFIENVDILLHECTHIYQFQTMGFALFFIRYVAELVTFGGRSEVYRYNNRDLPFHRESLEGQAEMVGHYANYMAGGQPSNADSQSTIEKKLKSTNIFWQ